MQATMRLQDGPWRCRSVATVVNAVTFAGRSGYFRPRRIIRWCARRTAFRKTAEFSERSLLFAATQSTDVDPRRMAALAGRFDQEKRLRRPVNALKARIDPNQGQLFGVRCGAGKSAVNVSPFEQSMP